MAGDDAGSFWSTFGGTSAVELSSLAQLLQADDCTVEALLNEEEIIQEFKACNERLVARLSEPVAAKALLEFMVCEPPEQATSKRCFRYPFIAVELMTCGPDQFFKALVSPDHPEILDTLWAFLEATPPSEVNPVLAGYFSRAAASIFSKHPAEVADYLRKKGVESLLDRFLDRLHFRSLAELFARLLCTEQPAHMLFPVEGLVARLLQRLEDKDPTDDTRENVTLVILELLAQKESLCFGDEILKQLTSSSSVSFLVNHIFTGGPGSVTAATSILSNIVIHTYVAVKGISVSTTPTLSPLSPTPMPTSLGEEDVVNTGADDALVGEVAPPKLNSPPRSPSAPGKPECPAVWLEARSNQLMREICTHLPRLCGLLDGALERTKELQMPHGPVSGVGSTALEAVNLLSMLARTGSAPVLEALLREQLLPRCLELFFRHPWSSLLHNAVRILMGEVLGSTASPELVLMLLGDGGLLARVVAEYREETRGASPGEPPKGRQARVGYMGQLHDLCRALRDYGQRVPECGAALHAADGWLDIVLPAVDASQQVQSEKLGGGIPAEDRGLASSNLSSTFNLTDSAAVKSGIETDFVLDDLNGVDERTLGSALGQPSGSLQSDETLPLPAPADDLFDPEFFDKSGPQPRSAPAAPAAPIGWTSNDESWVADFEDTAVTSSPAMTSTAPPPSEATQGQSGTAWSAASLVGSPGLMSEGPSATQPTSEPIISSAPFTMDPVPAAALVPGAATDAGASTPPFPFPEAAPASAPASASASALAPAVAPLPALVPAAAADAAPAASPAPAPAPAPAAIPAAVPAPGADLGAENLFALLDTAGQARQAAPVPSGPLTTSPWSNPAAPVNASCLEAFDPLFQPSTPPRAATQTPWPSGFDAGGDLSALWPSGSSATG